MSDTICSIHLDPANEIHPFIKRYKTVRFGRWPCTYQGLCDAACVQICLVALARHADATALAQDLGPMAEKNEYAWEAYREWLLPSAIYAAGFDRKVIDPIFLTYWGTMPFGQRGRMRKGDVKIRNSQITSYLNGGIHEDATDIYDRFLNFVRALLRREPTRFEDLCLSICWVIADEVIPTHSLAGVERLKKAGISLSGARLNISLGLDKLRTMLTP
jgi:hypothetical protein